MLKHTLKAALAVSAPAALIATLQPAAGAQQPGPASAPADTEFQAVEAEDFTPVSQQEHTDLVREFITDSAQAGRLVDSAGVETAAVGQDDAVAWSGDIRFDEVRVVETDEGSEVRLGVKTVEEESGDVAAASSAMGLGMGAFQGPANASSRVAAVERGLTKPPTRSRAATRSGR